MVFGSFRGLPGVLGGPRRLPKAPRGPRIFLIFHSFFVDFSFPDVLKKSGRRFFVAFGPRGPSTGHGTVKKQFRMKNRSRGKGRDSQGPRSEQIRTSPCLGLASGDRSRASGPSGSDSGWRSRSRVSRSLDRGSKWHPGGLSRVEDRRGPGASGDRGSRRFLFRAPGSSDIGPG